MAAKLKDLILKDAPKGRLSWVITVLEILIVIAYFAVGIGGFATSWMSMDFFGAIQSVITAIIFLYVATIVITIMCFIPIFRSKGNLEVAVGNIIWLLLSGFAIF